MRIYHEQHYNATNFKMPSSMSRSARQIENTSQVNNWFTETITDYGKDVFNETILSQNFSLNNS